MVVSLGGPLATELGWSKKQRVLVERDRQAGLLRLSPTAAPAGYTLTGPASGAMVVATFSVPDITGPGRKAQPAPHRIEAGALIVEMPAWARAVTAPSAPAIADKAAAMPDKRTSMPHRTAAVPDRPAASAAPAARVNHAAASAQPAVSQAAPPRPGRERRDDPPTNRDAADPDQRDELEAKQLLRKGMSVRDVARDFGFAISTVAGWHEQVLAERKGQAA
jgi:hypothetical protein